MAYDKISLIGSGEKTYRPFWSTLARGVDGECDIACETTRSVPEALRGTLYRVGPGIFERAGYRKTGLLDGDGIVHGFKIDGDDVRYRCRFVQTDKFKEESAAGRFKYASWTTRAPGGVLKNLGGNLSKDDASVTAYPIGEDIWVDGPISAPWRVDSETLETLGLAPSLLNPGEDVEPHAKYDAASGTWTFFSRKVGRKTELSAITIDRSGRVVGRASFISPRACFMHDFFVTAHYAIWMFQPVFLRLTGFLMGMNSFLDGFDWRPQEGVILAVLRKDGSEPPIFIDAPGRFMWHSVNAYELGDEIVADFVGYDDPGMWVGEDPILRTVMRDEPGRHGPNGQFRRYIIDPRRASVREELILDDNMEFPVVAEKEGCRPYTFFYTAAADPGCAFHHRIARVAPGSGETVSFDFGQTSIVCEPIFVSKPGRSDSGWLLTVRLDGVEAKSHLEIFDTDRLPDGPIATARIGRHLPITFHGCWRPSSKETQA